MTALEGFDVQTSERLQLRINPKSTGINGGIKVGGRHHKHIPKEDRKRTFQFFRLKIPFMFPWIEGTFVEIAIVKENFRVSL